MISLILIASHDDPGADAPRWQDQALCAQTDPEAFFPEKGGSTREAKRVCMLCEVRVQCLDYALDNDERFGIWGGLSERERRRVKKGAIDDEEVELDDAMFAAGPRTMREHCSPGGVLHAAGISLGVAQTWASRGKFIPPCGPAPGRGGVRLYDTAGVVAWLNAKRGAV